MKPIPVKLAQTFFGKVNVETTEREEFYNSMKLKFNELELDFSLDPVWRNYFKVLYFGEIHELFALFTQDVSEVKLGSVEWFYHFDQGNVNKCFIEPFDEKHKAKLVEIFDHPILVEDNAFYLAGALVIPALFDQLVIDGFKANDEGVFFDAGLPYKIHKQL